MKKLYLVRHAKSSWKDRRLSDFERPLNGRGKRDAPLMAQRLKDKINSVDLMISSHAVRASITAKEFDKIFNSNVPNLKIDQNLYHASESGIWNVIFGLDDRVSSVMLFGHNPGMTNFSNLFGAEYIDNVPTCGIFYLSSKTKKWNDMDQTNTRRNWFIYPKMFNS